MTSRTLWGKVKKYQKTQRHLFSRQECEEFKQVAEHFTMDLITNNLVQIEIKYVPTGFLSLILPPAFTSITMTLKFLCEIPLDTEELILRIKKKKKLM